MDRKPTIQELEQLLNSEEDTPIQILPNGEIREVGQTPTDNGTAIQWRELNVEELRTRVPALKTVLADLERAKAISQETLKAEISV